MSTIGRLYPCICPVCGRAITPGETIEWSWGGVNRHATCTLPVIPPGAIHIEGNSGYGNQRRRAQNVLRNSHLARDGDRPRHQYVLTAEQPLPREEGMPFGVGDKSRS